jgi:hypothetical protein
VTAETDEAARYARFRDRVVAGDPVDVKAGPGGLSFYVSIDGRRRFACHFNARPRREESNRGFADFKPQDTGLDQVRVTARLEELLQGKAECRRGARWWSAHFAADQDLLVADAFRKVVVEPLLTGREVAHD